MGDDQRLPDARLTELGLTLPTLTTPRGSYVRARRFGDLVFLAGHGPPADKDGHRPVGRVGEARDLNAAYDLARGCGLALLASLKAEIGSLDRVVAVIRVIGMVNAAPGFDATPAVINGCSDLFIAVFGPTVGAHARSAIGVAELPYGIPVEVEAIVAAK